MACQNEKSNTFASDVLKAFSIVFFGECAIMVFTNAPIFAAFFSIILFSITPFISMTVVLHPFAALVIVIISGLLIKIKLTGYPRLFSLVILISLWQVYGFMCLNLYIVT